MFGHQDDQHHHHDDDNKPMDDVLAAPAVDHVLETEQHDATSVVSDDFNPALPPANNDVTAPVVADGSAPDDGFDVIATSPTDPAPAPVTESAPSLPATDNNDLLGIKQQVLTSLSPLVDHLDQTPEEKFRTTMMMIQASDNKDLIQTAYNAAQGIGDEKVKAQALLDIVNEINYFTQQTTS